MIRLVPSFKLKIKHLYLSRDGSKFTHVIRGKILHTPLAFIWLKLQRDMLPIHLYTTDMVKKISKIDWLQSSVSFCFNRHHKCGPHVEGFSYFLHMWAISLKQIKICFLTLPFYDKTLKTSRTLFAQKVIPKIS